MCVDMHASGATIALTFNRGKRSGDVPTRAPSACRRAVAPYGWPDLECLLAVERCAIHSRVSSVAREIASQPGLWRRAGALAEEVAGVLPAAAERVCAVGCGT